MYTIRYKTIHVLKILTMVRKLIFFPCKIVLLILLELTIVADDIKLWIVIIINY